MNGDFFEHKAGSYDQSEPRVQNVDNTSQAIVRGVDLRKSMRLMDFVGYGPAAGAGPDRHISLFQPAAGRSRQCPGSGSRHRVVGVRMAGMVAVCAGVSAGSGQGLATGTADVFRPPEQGPSGNRMGRGAGCQCARGAATRDSAQLGAKDRGRRII